MIADAVAGVRKRYGLPVDPARRGPVLVSEFFEQMNLTKVALSGLSCGRVTEHLEANETPVEPFGLPDDPLAGFLFFAGRFGWAFVNADDILPRRRFSAAHELGHAVLHREKMGRFIADVTIAEADEATSEIEREANQFAAELLMPKDVCWARAEELEKDHGMSTCPRLVLAYRLASELLVSREAARYRLKALGIGHDD